MVGSMPSEGYVETTASAPSVESLLQPRASAKLAKAAVADFGWMRAAPGAGAGTGAPKDDDAVAEHWLDTAFYIDQFMLPEDNQYQYLLNELRTMYLKDADAHVTIQELRKRRPGPNFAQGAAVVVQGKPGKIARPIKMGPVPRAKYDVEYADGTVSYGVNPQLIMKA